MHQLGVTVEPLDAQTKRQLQLPANVNGLVVTDTKDGSPASSHLLTPRNGGPDIIVSVEGKPVQTPEQLKAALQGVKDGDIVSVTVYNPGQQARRIERMRIGSNE
jgi:S1-C subfamily serine protease